MLIKTFTTFTVLLFLAGCATTIREMSGQPPPQDEVTNDIVETSRMFLDLQETLREELEVTSEPEVPVAPIVPVYDPLADVMVSVNVDNGDVQYVLQALTSQAGVNLLIHPTLVESPQNISVHFTDVPASVVLKQVMRLADLAGRVQDNVLVVRPLEERIFHLDFLELGQSTRYSAGGDVLGTSDVSSLTGTGGGGTSSSSNDITGEFTIEGSTPEDVNPYNDVIEMLDILVGSSRNIATSGVAGAGSVAEVGQLSRISMAQQSDTPFYSLNRMTGTLYVQAKPSVMETVATLVQRYKEVLGRQILIEAQILEVALGDDFQYGIDWNHLNHKFSNTFGTVGQTIGGVTTAFPTGENDQIGRSITIPGQVLTAAGRAFGSVGFATNEFAATITMLEGYGSIKVLSNPTIRSKHGKASIISVGTSTSFVTQSANTAFSGVGNTFTQNIQTSSVFDGLVLGVIPFIADGGEITLSIHPIQSNVDPDSLGLVQVGDTAITLPRVSLKEISTLLKMHDGDVVILGGLIDQTDNDSRDQVPGFGSIPLFGYLFKNQATAARVRELVMVLKVSII